MKVVFHKKGLYHQCPPDLEWRATSYVFDNDNNNFRCQHRRIHGCKFKANLNYLVGYNVIKFNALNFGFNKKGWEMDTIEPGTAEYVKFLSMAVELEELDEKVSETP